MPGEKPDTLPKVSSGVAGLDEITGGGLPAGRPTLVIGGPGSGKTLLATTFLVHGALHDREPGVLVSFDEPPADLAVNSRSLGFDLDELQRRGVLGIEHVQIERQHVIEAGDYDLEALFIRLDLAVRTLGAKRVVLDSLDTLFANIPNEAILRAELRRLFGWLKERGLSTVITTERGPGDRQLSRHGIEEYVSDCVIVLDARVHDELATRRLRIVKYRGTAHGGNEYPFLIDRQGVTVLPITSLGLEHAISDERVSSGVPGLDAMLGATRGGAHGFYKASSVLVSGGPGTGKTSVAANFAAAACARGERCLYFAFEESERQLVRNMRSLGVDLEPFVADERLHVHAVRPTFQGLEMHLATMMFEIQRVRPDVVVVDPLSALLSSGTTMQSRMMTLRLVDYVKSFGATGLFLSVDQTREQGDLEVSSLMDTWIVLDNVRRPNDLERRLLVMKSRGMPHSPDIRRFAMSGHGIEIRPSVEGA